MAIAALHFEVGDRKHLAGHLSSNDDPDQKRARIGMRSDTLVEHNRRSANGWNSAEDETRDRHVQQ
jgi:hypothetical protein